MVGNQRLSAQPTQQKVGHGRIDFLQKSHVGIAHRHVGLEGLGVKRAKIVGCMALSEAYDLLLIVDGKGLRLNRLSYPRP